MVQAGMCSKRQPERTVANHPQPPPCHIHLHSTLEPYSGPTACHFKQQTASQILAIAIEAHFGRASLDFCRSVHPRVHGMQALMFVNRTPIQR